VENLPLPEAKPLKPSEKVVPPPPPSKKKKGKSLAALTEEEEKEKASAKPGRRKGKVVEAPAKKKGLRRKVAFKAQQGMEGMELLDAGRMYTPARKKKAPGKKLTPKKTKVTIPKPSKRVAQMGETIVLGELAKRMGVKSRELVDKLSALGQPHTALEAIDYETAVLVAAEFQFEVVKRTFEEAKILAFPAPDQPEELSPRPPVVTVMGHVDHGKTSLLDYIRKTRVAEREAGQITQHIGASVVDGPGGKIVFVDTPGHEAFTSMRARGAKVTDLVVLVVAADDGVMPQTREAVNHAQAAEVPILVAINKMDLPGANPDRIVQELAKLNLTPEEWGGTTMVVKCSAKTGQGMTELLEAILLQAEVMELRANPKKAARGVILESRLDRGKGPVASVLIEEGTLRVGDAIICGAFSGRARALFDDRGRPLKEVGPSLPAEVLGLDGCPLAGDSLLVVDEDRKAKLVSEHRAEELRQKGMTGLIKFTLEDFLRQAQQEEVRQLNVIVKTDTQGSLEAIKQAMEKLNTEQTKILIIHDGVGGITDNDVLLASAGKAVILGFMVRPESSAVKLAERQGVDLKLYQVIYNLLEEMKAALKGMLKPVTRERILGHAEVRNIFNITKVGTIGGCYVTDGVIQRNAKVRLLRDQVVVFDGKVASLKRVKDDAREVPTGMECGVALENFNDIHLGDVVESFVVEEVAPL
jgi:translation initiation factor IF-2